MAAGGNSKSKTEFQWGYNKNDDQPKFVIKSGFSGTWHFIHTNSREKQMKQK